MKIHYKQSIKAKLNELSNDSNNISFVELSEGEYIQFLEELEPIERILLKIPNQERSYKNLVIKVLSS